METDFDVAKLLSQLSSLAESQDFEALRRAITSHPLLVQEHSPVDAVMQSAIMSGDEKLIAGLVNIGADLGPNDGGEGPLYWAIRDCKHNVKMVSVLLGLGASPIAHFVNGWTPLHISAAFDNREAIPLLLTAGANLNVRTGIDDNDCPIETAAKCLNDEMVEFLAQLGADPRREDENSVSRQESIDRLFCRTMRKKRDIARTVR